MYASLFVWKVKNLWTVPYVTVYITLNYIAHCTLHSITLYIANAHHRHHPNKSSLYSECIVTTEITITSIQCLRMDPFILRLSMLHTMHPTIPTLCSIMLKLSTTPCARLTVLLWSLDWFATLIRLPQSGRVRQMSPVST